jgi:hypothetical protein
MIMVIVMTNRQREKNGIRQVNIIMNNDDKSNDCIDHYYLLMKTRTNKVLELPFV